MNDVKETIKLLKDIIEGNLNNVKYNRITVLRKAKKLLQSHAEAEGELGEEKQDLDWQGCTYKAGKHEGYNQLHSKALPIIARYKLRVKELEEAIKTGKCKHIAEGVISGECSLCHLAWCERRIKELEKKLEETDKVRDDLFNEMIHSEKQLQSTKEELEGLKEEIELRSKSEKMWVERFTKIKEKLTVIGIVKIMDRERGYTNPEQRMLDDRIAQALLKNLGVEDE